MKGEKLEKFTDRIMSDVNAAMSCLNLYIGDRVGLFKALQLLESTDAKRLADYSQTNERYIKEWLECMAAGAYIDHDPVTGKFSIPSEHALALTRQDNPYYMAAFLCWIPAMHDMAVENIPLNGKYDLITAFECLHDMAYPQIALRKMKEMLAEDGAVLISEEAVGDNLK